MSEQQELPISLLEYYAVWEAANAYGVSSMDGLLQLIRILPAEWQMWVASISIDFVDQAIEDAEIVDLRRLIDHVCIQYHQSGGPHPGHHLSPAELVPERDSDSDVASDSDHLEPIEPDQIVPEPIVDDPMGEIDLVPDLPSFDHEIASPMDLDDYHSNGEYSPIDLDLYGQPFALDSPLLHNDPPPLYVPDLPPPLPIEMETEPSRPPGVIRNFKYEPEFVTPVGTSHLQPLTLSQMPFITDDLILNPNPLSYRHGNFSSVIPPPEAYRERYVEEEMDDDVPVEEPRASTRLSFHFQQGTAEDDAGHWEVNAVEMEIQNLLDDETVWGDR